MQRMVLPLLATALAVLALAVPASGVWGGGDDGNGHPMVGAVYADIYPPYGQIDYWEAFCTGAYAGSTKAGIESHDVFLTAAHCRGYPALFGADTFYVSFDPDPGDSTDATPGRPDGLIEADQFVFDPRASEQKKNNWYDTGLLLLPKDSTDGIEPVELPPAGYLDGLKADGELKGSEFELVGYGIQPIWGQPGGPTGFPVGKRRTARATASGLTSAWLYLLQNPQATGLGGICLGDSGSPQFVPATLMVVSTTSNANGACHATSWHNRLDTPAAREFLDDYLDLPS